MSTGKPGGMQQGFLSLLPEMKDLFGQALTKYKSVSTEMKDEVVGYLKESVVKGNPFYSLFLLNLKLFFQFKKHMRQLVGLSTED
jgi:hypothetical protein